MGGACGVVRTGPRTWDSECMRVSPQAAISHCHQQELYVLLLRAGGLLELPFQPPKVPWWHQPVPTATSPWMGFREESHSPTGPADAGLGLGSTILICWHWKKIVGDKIFGTNEGKEHSWNPGSAEPRREQSRCGTGQGLQVQGRGCRCPGEPGRCEVRWHQALSEVGLALSGSSSW